MCASSREIAVFLFQRAIIYPFIHSPSVNTALGS